MATPGTHGCCDSLAKNTTEALFYAAADAVVTLPVHLALNAFTSVDFTTSCLITSAIIPIVLIADLKHTPIDKRQPGIEMVEGATKAMYVFGAIFTAKLYLTA